MSHPTAQILAVKGVRPQEIAYNPAVILQNHQKYIAIRIESRTSDCRYPDTYDTHIMFFIPQGNQLVLAPYTPIFIKYEDPAATWISSSFGSPGLLFSAVWVNQTTITTRFFLAPEISQLDPYRPILEITGMKDVRLCQLPDKRLAVFTQPVGMGITGGKICFTITENISTLARDAQNAPLLPLDGVDSKHLTGANEVYYRDGLIHVFAHIATQSEDKSLHYSAYQFNVDPAHPFDQSIQVQKICSRSDFPDFAPKSPRLADVVFPGGTGGPEQKDFYCGLSDSAVGVITL